MPRLGGLVRALADDALSLLIPADCPGCGSDAGTPCPECARRLLASRPTVVHLESLARTPVVAAGSYDGSLRSMLVAHKERARSGLTRPLAASLADAVAVAIDLSAAAPRIGPSSPLLLVPVPSRRSVVRRRGQDTVAALAKWTARHLSAEGIPAVSTAVLRHQRTVRDQVGLSPGQRHRNLDRAFAVAATPSWARYGDHCTVIVVDDITTTGSTLHEAIRALRAAGARPVAAATLATAIR